LSQVAEYKPGHSVLFDDIVWREPMSGRPLEPIVAARTPAGVPISGALRVSGTDTGYPIVDSVARLTVDLAHRYRHWLEPFDLAPPDVGSLAGEFQSEDTVESFGFQWTWNSEMRTELDLLWRVATRFQLAPRDFAGKVVLDAGAGAGDQSRWLLDHGACVVSIDLSSAIDVVARKLRDRPGWVGVQGDLMALPFAPAQMEMVYCEGVLPFTGDAAAAVRELCRVTTDGGLILATHYATPGAALKGRLRHAVVAHLRSHLSRMDRYELLWATGSLAALAYVPGLRTAVRKSGIATYGDAMPDFKTTWTNTFDTYGDHTYQRYISESEFWGYFEAAGAGRRIYSDGTVVVAQVESVGDRQPGPSRSSDAP